MTKLQEKNRGISRKESRSSLPGGGGIFFRKAVSYLDTGEQGGEKSPTTKQKPHRASRVPTFCGVEAKGGGGPKKMHRVKRNGNERCSWFRHNGSASCGPGKEF